MGRSLYERFATARDLYDQANEVLGWDLKSVSFEGPEAALTETRVCQPALYVHGYVVYSILSEQGKVPDVAAALGLSLGELTALAAAGVYDFASGLRLVAERGRLMQMACDATSGGMASVIGGSPEAVEELCRAHDIEIANLNCPGQIVISGEKEKVLQAVENAQGRGFKLVKPLNVAGAYHSRLMQPARDAFATFIEDFHFDAPRIAVYTNVTGQSVADSEAIKANLIRQIVSPVQFEACLRQAAIDHSLSQFYECGTGRVLAGLARRTDRALQVTSISEADEFPA